MTDDATRRHTDLSSMSSLVRAARDAKQQVAAILHKEGMVHDNTPGAETSTTVIAVDNVTAEPVDRVARAFHAWVHLLRRATESRARLMAFRPALHQAGNMVDGPIIDGFWYRYETTYDAWYNANIITRYRRVSPRDTHRELYEELANQIEAAWVHWVRDLQAANQSLGDLKAELIRGQSMIDAAIMKGALARRQ